MPRLTDSGGYCYSCGQRPATHDYAPPQGGVLGYCHKCIRRVIAMGAKQAADGVFEVPRKAAL